MVDFTFDEQDIEQKLKYFFSPVQPDPRFISHLQRRLVNPPEITVENRRSIVAVLMIGLIFFTGLVLVFYLRSGKNQS